MAAVHKLLASALLFFVAVSGSHGTPISNVYVIGDSLSDQGNLLAATSTIPGAPALPDPLHYFNGRFSNGPAYTDYLANALGLPLTPSFFPGGTNFAYGGARTNYNTVEQQAPGNGGMGLPNNLFPWSLNGEVQDFSSRNFNDPNGLFIVMSGNNDVADMVRFAQSPGTQIPIVVTGIVDAVNAMKAAGAQRVVVSNVADIGKTPAFLAAGPAASAAATNISLATNAALHNALAGISGIQIIEFNLFKFLQDLVANPGQLGLTNVSTPCYTGFVLPNANATECATPDEFLFWDLVHPTTRVHAALAQAVLAAIPEPSIVMLIILPLFGIFLLRRRTHTPAAAVARRS